ncbi:6-phosphogluconolactonase [Paenibacillus uliginis N3/975]|uniref:6-phosphogluconolactonase n=1 Tax=Paenibacillus uliginis N3/975 TaxID=1313296 RepID=A0A1X7H9R6_9BACL|nr:lactonase family protein [Paenibacillus uliginis]SMF82340.1 6-phosphogluconolactonase [Paenibacillus uliginis N3/975]
METAKVSRTLVFTGSYAETGENGICVYSFDQDSGELQLLDQSSGIKNPTFLNVDTVTNRLYAIGEVSENGGKVGEVVTFDIDPSSGRLNQLSHIHGSSSSTCHIQRDLEDKYLIVSSYHGGRVSLLSLDDNGVADSLLDEQYHEGHRTDAEQQPRAHSAFFSPDGKYIFVQDLGLDKIIAYQINKTDNKLEFHGETQLTPGSGPRHLAFHTSGKYAYVINELNSTVTAFRYVSEEGRLETIQTISTLPADFTGESYCAEIAVSEDGRTVYGSNRGHDSIVVFSVDASSGELSPIQYISTEGGHPRHFSLMPEGKFMIVANRDGNNLVLFTVDPENGTLQFTGKTIEQSKPVCVKPAVFMV